MHHYVEGETIAQKIIFSMSGKISSYLSFKNIFQIIQETSPAIYNVINRVIFYL